MQRFTILTIVALLMLSPAIASAQPIWVSTFGSHPRYRLPHYVTGFSAVEASERGALEIARTQALDDLVRKIRVSIRSEIVTQGRDDGVRSASSYHSLTRSSSELEVAAPRFLIERGNGTVYALAYVRVDALHDSYTDAVGSGIERLARTNRELSQAVADGRLSEAGSMLNEAERTLEQIASDLGVLKALSRLSQLPRPGGASGIQDIEREAREMEEELREVSARLTVFTPQRYEHLVEYVANRLSADEVGVTAVMPLRYENTDFSSAFGTRLSQAVADRLRELQARTPAQRGVLEGSYWVDDERLELTVRVRRPQTGEVLTSVRSSGPLSMAGSLELRPANAEDAIASQALLIGEAIADGGIAVEAWTDKGRDQEVLVFEEGEPVQFYFRVNRPAHLQLTYQLATGEMVLLEPDFYIGTDLVHRIVELPYRFVVVPPFGIERLVVTASSTSPPPPDTVVRTIAGQPYEVFRGAGEPVARTRGLAREPVEEREAAVGEVTLTITTIARQP